MCFVVKPVINDINEVMKGFQIAAEGKERDTAAKKIIKTVEGAAEQASKNDVITARLVDHQGKLTSTVYKQRYEENQKQLKLMEVSEYLGNDPDRNVRARNLFNTVRTVFHDNGLTLPSSTRIEIWGHDEKRSDPSP